MLQKALVIGAGIDGIATAGRTERILVSTFLGCQNGAIYMADKVTAFTGVDFYEDGRHLKYEMDAESSIDVDTERDFMRAKRVLEKRHAK